jgi:small GTP-binding protein
MFSNNSFKIILIGKSAVGKSSLIHRLCFNSFGDIESTIGCAFNRKHMYINDKKIALDCWDTAGQERFKSIIPMYFKGVSGVLLVYDVTRKDSFNELINYWIPLVLDYYDRDNLPQIVIAANKIDLLEFNIDGHEEKIKGLLGDNILYFKTSAKNNINIMPMFKKLASLLIEEDEEEEETIILSGWEDEEQSLCCYY